MVFADSGPPAVAADGHQRLLRVPDADAGSPNSTPSAKRDLTLGRLHLEDSPLLPLPRV